MVMHLKSCCCGCSLKTGSVFVGVMSTIGSLVGLIACIVVSSMLTGQAQKEANIQEENPDFNDSNSEGHPGLLAILIIASIISAIHLIISILMVFGASAERAHLVKPWIVYNILATGAYALLQGVRVIIFLSAGLIMTAMLSLVIVAVYITFEVYFILVVNSFHTELLQNAAYSNKV